jgi:hypothetical protein
VRKYYQIYADNLLPPVAPHNKFRDIFNRLANLLSTIDTMTISNKQIRILLDDSEKFSEKTEIKIGIEYYDNRPSFIQVSATTPEKANEIFRALIHEEKDGEKREGER